MLNLSKIDEDTTRRDNTYRFIIKQQSNKNQKIDGNQWNLDLYVYV